MPNREVFPLPGSSLDRARGLDSRDLRAEPSSFCTSRFNLTRKINVLKLCVNNIVAKNLWKSVDTCGKNLNVGATGPVRPPLNPAAEADSLDHRSLQIRVFSFGLLQDGNVGIGVFPVRKEIIVGGLCFSGVARESVSTCEAEMNDTQLNRLSGTSGNRRQETSRAFSGTCARTPGRREG